MERLERRVEALEKLVKRPKVIREFRRSTVSGFTPQGGIAVIANQLGVVARTLIEARNELVSENGADTGDYARPSVFVANGLLSSAATGLQSVLDSVASFCHKLEPDEDHVGYLYFNSYPFRVLKWEFIRGIRRAEIESLSFGGIGFNDLANQLKHDLPWLGLLSQDVNGLWDIRDGGGKAVFRDVLVPVYRVAKQIVQRLGSMQKQPIDLPHV